MITNARKSIPSTIRSRILLAATAGLLLSIPGAFAQGTTAVSPGLNASEDEVRQFCTNIADAARDQRYLLQKQDLEKLQAEVDERIKTLETRRAEYEDWLTRRNDFLKQAQAGLIDIYKTMKADAAAGQLELVNSGIAAAIVMKLPARQSSLILSEMDAKKAAELADLISAVADPNTSRKTSKEPS